MDAPGTPRPLPSYTRSTLPDPRTYTDTLIVVLEPDGTTRTSLISNGVAWAGFGAGSVAIGAVTGLAAGAATFLATPSSANFGALMTDKTGTGLNVFQTSPSLITPNLGTPSFITLTAGTGLPISTGVSGLATNMATFLATPSSANLAATVTDETGSGLLVFGTSPTLGGTVAGTFTLPATATMAATPAALDRSAKIATTLYADSAAAVSPIVSVSAAKTFALTDGGTTQLHPAADTTARTWTIDANATVAFPVGTVITIDNESGAGILTIAITTDTLQLVGAAGTTGSRTLASGGRAVVQKIASTKWRISGGAELT